PPRDPEERAEQAELGAHLRVIRLAGLDRRPRARRRLADVTEPVSLRVMHDGADAVLQRDRVLVQRRLALGQRVSARGAARLRPLALDYEVVLRPVAGRRDGGEHVRQPTAIPTTT